MTLWQETSTRKGIYNLGTIIEGYVKYGKNTKYALYVSLTMNILSPNSRKLYTGKLDIDAKDIKLY